MERPERVIDADAVRMLSAYSGLDLPEDRVEAQLAMLKDQIAIARSWEPLDLGFTFTDTRFSFVRPAVVYRLPWEHDEDINGNKGALDAEGA